MPTRVVIEWRAADNSVTFKRRPVIAFTIQDNDELIYMSSNGMTYSFHKGEFGFAEVLQNGEWVS